MDRSQVHSTASAAVTIWWNQLLNELAAGDFRNREQVRQLLALSKDTLEAFEDFKRARPKRFQQLLMLLTYPREGHRRATELRALSRSGLLDASFGVDWFAARYSGRGLVKALRSAGLLTAAPGRDWYARALLGDLLDAPEPEARQSALGHRVYTRYEPREAGRRRALLFSVLKETDLMTADAGKEWYVRVFASGHTRAARRLTEALVIAGFVFDCTADSDWFERAYGHVASFVRRWAIGRLRLRPDLPFVMRHLSSHCRLRLFWDAGHTLREFLPSVLAQVFDSPELFRILVDTRRLPEVDEAWIVEHFKDPLYRIAALMRAGVVGRDFDFLEAVFGGDKYKLGIKLQHTSGTEPRDWAREDVLTLEQYRSLSDDDAFPRVTYSTPDSVCHGTWCRRSHAPHALFEGWSPLVP